MLGKILHGDGTQGCGTNAWLNEKDGVFYDCIAFIYVQGTQLENPCAIWLGNVDVIKFLTLVPCNSREVEESQPWDKIAKFHDQVREDKVRLHKRENMRQP